MAVAKAVRDLAPKEFSVGGLAYAARALTGGRAAMMELARLSNHEAVKAVVQEWDSWSGNKRAKAKLENACQAVGVEPAEFLSQVVKAAFEHNTDIAKLVATVNMPRVVGAMVKNAMKEKGYRDREMMLKQGGLLPTPGGQQINVQAIAAAKNQQAVMVPQGGLPAFEDSMLAGMKAVRGAE